MLNFPIKSWEGIWIQRYFDVEYLFLFKQNFKEGLLWASLVAQMVKNLSVMQENLVQSLGEKDPLEKGMATHSSILA